MQIWRKKSINYLHKSAISTNFAMCFSWYRFKVNWIGCRETINFFLYIFKCIFRINVRISEAQAEQYREPGRLEINHKVVMNDFSPVSSHIRIFVAAVCYACRRVSTFGKRGVRDMRRLRASCGFAYQYAL